MTTARTASFGPYEVELRSGELRKYGVRVRMGEQPFQILLMLLANPGEMVTREELRAKLWTDDTFVDFDHGLNSAVQRLRDCLSDTAETPLWIETIPRRGYRFIGTLEMSNGVGEPENPPSGEYTIAATRSAEDRVASGGPPAVPESARPHHWKLVTAILGASAIVLAALLFVRRSEESHAAARAARITSIAVLPLENLSGDAAQEYVADGMTDELITELARTTGMRVISRTSVMQYKGVHRPLPDVARELGVDGIVEGSVLNQGGQIRVTVQLVQAASDTHVWAQSYIRDSSDLLLLQQELAESVAREVSSTALPREPVRVISPDAHDAYLRGRYAWFGADTNLESARGFFAKAIQLQPDYAAAYSGLADYYTAGAVDGLLDPIDALPKGEAATLKALQLDDSVPEAHNSMAGVDLFYRWNWKAAEAESQKAIELDPNYAEAYHLYGWVLLVSNRPDEALEAQRKSQELDPFTRPWGLGNLLISLGKYKDAEIELRQRIAALPTNDYLHGVLAEALYRQGRDKEFADEYAEVLRIEGHENQAAEVHATFAAKGTHGVQKWRLAQLKQLARHGYVSPLEFAFVYARLGQKDEAFRWLDKAYDDHVPWLVRIHQHSELDPLRGDPRYRALVKRIGLPELY
jgi:TolB-like protein/DNA-binding winged helix-turn-helix (wHTH) protein/tetratricopeptide (TPR) repeat protein